MSTGRIAVINYNGRIRVSTEFNGGMDPETFGKKAINLLKRVDETTKFHWFIADFNDNYFAYEETLVQEVPDDWYNTIYNYPNKWHCDYVYIKNLSANTKYFVTPDGFVALPPEEILILHFGKGMKQKVDKLAHINIGDIVTIANIEWIVLKKNDDSVFCLTKNLISTEFFDSDTQNYAKSNIRTALNVFAQTIKNNVGKDSLLSREIDLTTNKGKTLYGIITDVIGLLTESEYKEFESVIRNYPVDTWWWLATADSEFKYVVRCIDSEGALGGNGCGLLRGVRPACIFKAEVFE